MSSALADDLAAHEPGHSARTRAERERWAAPIFAAVADDLGAPALATACYADTEGELRTAATLAGLGDEWRVLHSVPVTDRGTDIEHLVIGPAGVFAVNTRNHPSSRVFVRYDSILVDNASAPYVRASRHEVSRVRQALTATVEQELPVFGIIAVVARDLVLKAQPRDGVVRVVRNDRIARCLSTLEPVLDAADVDAVYTAARRASTWL